MTVQRVTLGRLIPEINRKQVQNTNQGAAVIDPKAIFVENRDFNLPHLHSRPPLGGSRRNIAMPFGRKTRMVGLPDGEKKFKIRLFVFT